MAGFSNVTVMGNMTRDPELRYTPQGTAVVDITLAVSKKRGRNEETAYIDCTIWGKNAENVTEYISKGQMLVVVGELKQDEWEDRQTGAKRTKLKVNATGITFVPTGKRRGQDRAEESRPMSHTRNQKPPRPSPKDELDDLSTMEGDDVPF